MALAIAEWATHNLAVDAAILTFGAAVAASSANDIMYLTFADVDKGVAAATGPSFTGGARSYRYKLAAGTEAIDNIWAIPGWHVAKAMGITPMFFKIANAAGDLT